MSLWGNLKSRTVTTLLALLLLAPAPVFANAGKILYARGEVAATNTAGERRDLDSGDAVDEGDRITTGADSMTQIRLSDGALISLRSHSDYRIIAQKDEGDLLEQAGKLFSGWMRSVTGAIGKKDPEAVRQETPVATIGIRGTTFQVIHIPPGGHPDFPDTAPGTYIYLQEGSIETSGAGEVRYLEAGDIVFIPADGGVPEPAPDMQFLFAAGEGDTVESDNDETLEQALGGEDRTTRDDLESTDALNESLTETFAGESADLVDAIGLGGFRPSFGGFYSFKEGDAALTFSGGQGPDRVLSRLTFNNGYDWVLEATGSSPGDSGYLELGNAAEVNWGVWGQGDYSITTNDPTINGGPTGPWIYMAASHQLALADIPASNPSGQPVTYNYAGGTQLYNPYSGTMSISGGSVTVDFSGATNMAFSLQTSTAQTYNGSGPISDFYNNFISLTGSGANPGNGSIRGSFVGENAEGIVSEVEICEGCDSSSVGTAVFAR